MPKPAAVGKTAKRKWYSRPVIALLALVIIGGAALRFYGLGWGIPKTPYYRNLYPDESFTLSIILKMHPPDFNPHYFINPTFHYYSLYLGTKVASLLGYIENFSLPVEMNKIAQPTEKITMGNYAKIYWIGRLISVLESILLIFLVFLIGNNLYNEKVGLISAAFTAVLPTVIYQSHFLVVDIAAVFWFALAFWHITRKGPRRVLRWIVVSGILSGLAIGTKYTNALLVIPFIYRLLTLPGGETAMRDRLAMLRYIPVFLAAAFAAFVLTTPYALLALGEFLRGNADGFGGIFGARGLFHYNNYPPHLLKPFTLATFHSLRLPLTIISMLSLIYLFFRRKRGDLVLLSVIIPFYLMHILHSSPQLRHVLLVLPLLMLAVGRVSYDIFNRSNPTRLKYLSLLAVTAVFIYTLLFTIAYIKRFTPDDTRLECAEWVRKNLLPKTSMGAANYAPLLYTPPIDMADIVLSPEDYGWSTQDLFIMVRDILLTDYDYVNLLDVAPEYFFITETEYRETPYTEMDKRACAYFFNQLFSERKYALIRVFQKDFKVFGLDFQPRFPNTEWNLVNQTIWLFRAKK